MHVSLISSTIGNWRAYLKELDNKIREKASLKPRLKSRRWIRFKFFITYCAQGKATRLFKADSFDPKQVNFPLAFSEVQRLEYFRGSIQEAVLILDTNLQILADIQAFLKSLDNRGFALSEQARRSLTEDLQLCVSRFTMHRKWAELSLARIQSISDLVCYIQQYTAGILNRLTESCIRFMAS